MRCLRSILGVNLRQRLRNDYICQQLIAQKTVIEYILSTKIHVNRRPVNSASYKIRSYKGNFNAKRPPGRPQMRWTDQIRKDTGLPLQNSREKDNGQKCMASKE